MLMENAIGTGRERKREEEEREKNIEEGVTEKVIKERKERDR